MVWGPVVLQPPVPILGISRIYGVRSVVCGALG